MHANYHRKDSAIIQEGFQRFRATEDCATAYCAFNGQRTTHFHCRRPPCNYTFKNKADMGKRHFILKFFKESVWTGSSLSDETNRIVEMRWVRGTWGIYHLGAKIIDSFSDIWTTQLVRSFHLFVLARKTQELSYQGWTAGAWWFQKIHEKWSLPIWQLPFLTRLQSYSLHSWRLYLRFTLKRSAVFPQAQTRATGRRTSLS